MQIELSRLRQKANATVDLLLTARATGQPDPPVGKDVAEYVNQRGAVVLDRAFLNQALIDVIEIGLGRKTVPIRKLRSKLRKVVDHDTGRERWEEETSDVTGLPIMEEYFERATVLNLPAANQAAHLLHGEINRQVSEGGELEQAEEGATNRWQEVAEAYEKALEERRVREARLINVTPEQRASAPENATRRQ